MKQYDKIKYTQRSNDIKITMQIKTQLKYN